MITYEAQQLQQEVNDLKTLIHHQLAMTSNLMATADKIDDQTTPVIGWGWAIAAGAVINVIALPLMQDAGIPYLSHALQKLDTIEQIIVQEIGITASTITEAVSGEGQGVHPQLMAIYRRANELAQQQGFTIHIRDGLRTAEEQAANVRSGASKTMNSRHLKAPNGWGHALDLEVLYEGPQSNAKDWEGVNKIKPMMFQAAKDLRLPIQWGGDWQRFKDGFHWQLPWETHNGKTQFAAPRNDQIPVITERNISALLNELKRTESFGGDYRAVSKTNCMLGAYQAAAPTLADLGYIKINNYRDAGSPEKGQAHCDFLNNPANWTIKGGQQTYLATTAIQDEFARKNITHNLKRGVREGAIDMTTSQETLMGYSKAAWLKPASAIDYYKTGADDTDGNGSAISKYAKQGEIVTQDAIAIAHAGTGNIYTIFSRIREALIN